MAKCSVCGGRAVITSDEPLCSSHFTGRFEQNVLEAVKRFGLISRGDRIIVASSGGKDSTTVLHVLKKYFGKVEALAIDEGIPGYRSITLEDLEKFCDANDVPLSVHSYRDEFGFSLSDALKIRKDLSPCHVCGVLRRHLLNVKARNFEKIATGHNLDDEAQSIMMNLVKAQMSLLSRLGPASGAVGGFVPRIKPLYLCTEKEVAAYAFIMGFAPRFRQCPHSRDSFRAGIRDAINGYEADHRGSKRNFVNNFLEILPKLRSGKTGLKLNRCGSCGEPCSRETCRACALIKSVVSVSSGRVFRKSREITGKDFK